MRRRRLLVILLLAIISGLMAGYAALQFLRERPNSVIPGPAQTNSQNVVVAARDLPVAIPLGREDVRVVRWPADALPAGFYQTVEEVIGRPPLAPVRTNEPILDSKLAGSDAGRGLALLVPDGMRAVPIRVDDVVNIAGYVQPQTRVDVLLTVNAGGAEGEVTKIIMQNVEVATANAALQHDEEGNPIPSSVVTFFVTPEDAEKITHASREGRIQLALRNSLDLAEAETEGAHLEEVLGRRRRPRGRAVVRTGTTTAPASTGIIEFYRAGRRTLISY